MKSNYFRGMCEILWLKLKTTCEEYGGSGSWPSDLVFSEGNQYTYVWEPLLQDILGDNCKVLEPYNV